MFSIGTVVASYPEGNSVDVLLDNGDRLSNVQVMVPTGSNVSGVIDLPDVGGPSPSDEARWDPTSQRDRYVKAVVGFCHSVPVVFGFLLPQVNEITFQEKNRRIVRHASDVYSSVDDSGNVEVYHPSGTYMRIGTSPAHEDLTAKDYDKKWAIARNTDKQVHVQLTVMNGGAQKASLNIDPSGNITLTHVGNLVTHTQGTASVTVDGNTTVHVGGNASVNVSGTTDVTSGGNASLTAPQVTIDSAQTTCTGHVTIQGGLNVSGGSGAAVAGNVTVTGGDVTADGHTLKNHTHPDPQGGNTGLPTG
jgi:phage baseplate assembly protein gpV